MITDDVLSVYIPSADMRTRYVLETLAAGAGLPIEIIEDAESDARIFSIDGKRVLRIAVANKSFASSVPELLKWTAQEIDEIDLLLPEQATVRAHLLSALFHILAGTEEVESDSRDRHDRFAAAASCISPAGFLDAPFFDLWGDAIVRAIILLRPSLQIIPPVAQLDVSHDVDAPFKHRFQSPVGLFKNVVGEVLRGRWTQAIKAPFSWACIRMRGVDRDPFNHFGWMMDQAESVGARCTFYVIAGHSGGRIDGDYDVYHPVMMTLWRNILDRGHLIGVHPSYNSFRSLPTLALERERVMEIYRRLGRPVETPPVRMHYLRFDPAVTPQLLANAGFVRDSSIGFADHSGFRRGTCRPFRLWDHEVGRQLDLTEYPLLLMDATLLAKRYEHLDQAGVERRVAIMAAWCHRFGGNLTLLWHNNYFEQGWHFSTYEKALRSLSVTG